MTYWELKTAYMDLMPIPAALTRESLRHFSRVRNIFAKNRPLILRFCPGLDEWVKNGQKVPSRYPFDIFLAKKVQSPSDIIPSKESIS